MINKRAAVRYGKASIVIFALCFTVVQLASLRQKGKDDDKLVHLKREEDSDDGGRADIDRDENRLDRLEKAPDANQDVVFKPADVQEKIILAKGVDDRPPEPIVGENAQKKDSQIEEPDHNDAEADNQNNDEPEDNNNIDEPRRDEHAVDADQDDPGEDDEGKDEEQEEEEGDEEEEEEDDEFPAHRLVDGAGKLRLDELQPPDHLDAVRLEQDGRLNKDYKKEILLGNHEEFEQQEGGDPEDLLEKIFDKVDADENNLITQQELEDWIILKVQEHFAESIQESERIFKHLDSENKGSVTWEDFHVHFLMAKGYDPKKAKQQASDYENIPLEPDDKERLIRYKFRWAEADAEPPENVLNLQEFKSFRHPEQSPVMLERMVQDILDNLDQDGNSEVNEEEFVALPPGEVDSQFVDSDKEWQQERRTEFRSVIDVNGDGKLTRDELKNYVDPQNPNHARLEAENLIELADTDDDRQLSLDEVLDNPELFLGSKMIDTGRNFHDEF